MTIDTTTAVTLASFDQITLKQLLHEAVELRESLQSKLQKAQSEFESLIGKAPKRLSETVAELDKEIDALERERTLNSLPLVQEREILKQISRVLKKKKEVEAFVNHDKQIKEKKAQVLEMRESLKPLRKRIEDLRSELSLTKTAAATGCSKDQLVCMKLDCPQEKLGSVIGKKGNNVKQLRQKTHVAVDISRDLGDIRITGALESLEVAALNLDKLISSRQEQFVVSEDIVDYLTSKHITRLEEMRTNYPDLFVSLKKNNTTVTIRGIPEDLENFRFELQNLDIRKQRIELPAGITSYLVGKKGANVDELVLLHQCAIHVERGEATSQVLVVGPHTNVQSAVAAIQEIAEKMREDTKSITVNPIIKEILLKDSGVGIQAIQKKVNDKKSADVSGFVNVNFSDDFIVLKGNATLLPTASDVVECELAAIEKKIVLIHIDPYAIPKVIGKGGEVIKKLSDGKMVVVSFDRMGGKATLCGLIDDDIRFVEQELRAIVANNIVERISLDASYYKTQIRNFLRTKAKEIQLLCNLHCDDDNHVIILRGNEQRLKEASALVRDYLKNNYIEELAVTNDDLQTLLMGGKSSKVTMLQTEHNVAITSDRDRNVVFVKGDEIDVKNALKAINQFSFGGAGCAVEKIDLNKDQIGVVIGKEGKTKAELQKKFNSLSISVNGLENRVTLRGPEAEVKACRLEIFRLVALMQITRSIMVTEKILERIKDNKQLLRGVLVTMTMHKDSIKLRGFADDVQRAADLINEEISGRYEGRLKLGTSQFRKIKDSCRDSNLIDRIQLLTGASIVLDSSDDCVVFGDQQKQVIAAKQEFMSLLAFVLGPTFSHIPIDASLLPRIGRAPLLAEISANSCASVNVDRDINAILVSGKSEEVEAAVSALRDKIVEVEKLLFVWQLEPTESWLISSLIGRKGVNIKNLRKETRCSIDIDTERMTITVSGNETEYVTKARKTLEAQLEKHRDEHVVVDIPRADYSAFVGRGGSNKIEFQKKHGVVVQKLKEDEASVVLHGNADAVKTAKADLLKWLQERDSTRKGADGEVTFQLKKYQIPVLIGPKGVTVSKLQNDTGCRIDIDKTKAIARIFGGNAEKRIKAIELIQNLLKEEQEAIGGSDDNIETSAQISTSPLRVDVDRKNYTKPEMSLVRKTPPRPPSYTVEDFPVLADSEIDDRAENGKADTVHLRTQSVPSVSSNSNVPWANVVKLEANKMIVFNESAGVTTNTLAESPPALDWSSDESHHDDTNSLAAGADVSICIASEEISLSS